MLSPGDAKNVRENRRLMMNFLGILRFDGRIFVNLILFARGLSKKKVLKLT